MKDLLNLAKGWRSIGVGLIFLLLPVLDYISKSDIISVFLSNPEHQKLASAFIGILIIVLRTISTTPVFSKTEVPVIAITEAAKAKKKAAKAKKKATKALGTTTTEEVVTEAPEATTETNGTDTSDKDEDTTVVEQTSVEQVTEDSKKEG